MEDVLDRVITTLEKIKGLKHLIDNGTIDNFAGYENEELKIYSKALEDVLYEFKLAMEKLL